MDIGLLMKTAVGRVPWILVLLLMHGWVQVQAQAPAQMPTQAPMQVPASAAAAAIQRQVEALRAGAPVAVQGVELASRILLPEFYERRQFAPGWSDARNPDGLLRAISESGLDGLEPRDYHLEAIRTLQAGVRSPEQQAQLDLLYTDAAILLGYHLHFGKVDPARLDSNWNFTPAPLGPVADVAARIEQALLAGRVYDELASLRPQQPLYMALRDALAEYSRLAASGGWEAIPAGPPSMAAGKADDRLPALRRRLGVTADGPVPPPGDASPDFDPATESAVRAFQRRHGLAEDGTVGPATLAALNVPVERRIDQLRIALERARWVMNDLPAGRFVLVNVAGFQVYVLEAGKIVWNSRIVVGKPYTSTPIFRDEIEYVVINPTWTVPSSIMRNEMLPAMRRDPSYLQRKGLTMTNGQIVQPPGDSNALGRIKIMFPNEHAVYLHDTPSKSLFERDMRAFSHGCMRVQDPVTLASLVLDDPDWSREKIVSRIEADLKTQTVYLKRKVPVLVLYSTALVGAESGSIYFYDDIYERDPPVLKALQQPFRLRDADRERALAGA